MEQIFNPYLPLYEHVPDGEPHVFGGRLYIYGSHDLPNGKAYCEGDYVTWSAPIDNLRDWRCEGVIYRKNQDPSYKEGQLHLWAPDVTMGPDGRYYLYYCFSFLPEIGVAVSSFPAGPFEFYGHVKYPEHINKGKVLREHMPFDPAVLTDNDGRVYLYYGFAPAAEKEMKLPELSQEQLENMPEDAKKRFDKFKEIKLGENGMVVELESDMVTTKEEPRVLIPGGHHTDGTGFEGHGFFEASSIRKVGSKYYLVYSSHKSHELCYAVSDKPDSGFVYGGTIISNGDIGLGNRTRPVYTLGNNHGGMEKVGDNWYIFYHRQTNGTEFSRQGCAEKIKIEKDGSIKQVEITSCGLNGQPLRAAGTYEAAIACRLTSPETLKVIDYSSPAMKTQARVVEHQNTVYIKDIKNGTTIGYKYFEGGDPVGLLIELRGEFKGTITVADASDGAKPLGREKVEVNCDFWKNLHIPLEPKTGKFALNLLFDGEGQLDMKTFSFI